MVGVYTLVELRDQIRIYRARFGETNDVRGRILTDSIPDSWTDDRMLGLRATVQIVLDSHLNWDAIAEFFEGELFTPEWIASLETCPPAVRRPMGVQVIMDWVSRGPTIQTDLKDWLGDHGIMALRFVGPEPTAANFEAIIDTLNRLHVGARLGRRVHYRDDGSDRLPDVSGHPDDFIFEVVEGVRNAQWSAAVSHLSATKAEMFARGYFD
ncbi:uncharacterized protein B0H18DRAFT_961548 [Fomitopsis serialis]|uniref:uncharacterized protein n=1 Tax=Fomitopsis serialis TaxID=139415 RepID=UPI00200751FB|nr:uncharacterized protein B0H18DRAFT_961548 [Neoantrodia serialis]KAH9911909.1 hypothetical protein B0H18DRAFT_961548 [Neoantrodia serialis]